MQKVKLTRDWKQYEEGDVLTKKDRPSYTLNFLLEQGWAVNLSTDETEPEKPTMDNTKKEIEDYLEAHDIEYSEYSTKQELLDLIE